MDEPAISTGTTGFTAARPAEGPVAPRAHRGPATVINPERRPGPAPAGAESTGQGSTATPNVARVLFPGEDEAAVSNFDAQEGVRLGQFSVIERIRSGGMGSVFRAIDLSLNRVVALKVLPPVLSRDPLIVHRFENEAQSAAQLDHENIARVFYIGQEQGLHFIAFEFVTGTNIRELIQQQGRLPVSDAVNYALQIASALVHTSAQGVVHRDVKPSNIIVTPGGRAKLVDLGLARKENRDDRAADLTLAGTTLGTFDYISPEQARDPRTADVRSDIYSLGCTLYHMLTGDPPYPEGTVLQKLLQHQGDEAPDPAPKNDAVPRDLSVVVRRMMAKDPRRRYQTAEQLVRDMMLVADGMGLKSVSAEGLVWLSPETERTSFWQRHLAWVSTVAVLLSIVVYLEYVASGRVGRAPSSSEISPRRDAREEDRSSAEETPAPPEESLDNADRTTLERTESRLRQGPGARESAGGPIAAESSSAERANRQSNRVEPNGDDRESGEPGVSKPIQSTEAIRTAAEGASAPGPQFDSAQSPARSTTGADVPPRGTAPARRIESGSKREDEAGEGQVTAEKSAPDATLAGASNSGGNATSRPLDHDVSSAVLAEESGIFLLGREGASDRKFLTLEAACSEIRHDGAVIELRFDGRRSESSLKITRKVTIRAGRGRRPMIEFRPTQVVTDGYRIRAVSIPSGSLDLVGVDLALVVDDTISAEHVSLFSIERPESLRLHGVTVTVINPRPNAATLVEMRPTAGALMPDMPTVGVPSLEIEIADSLLRGQCDLFVVRHCEPARIALRNCVVAVQGSLLSGQGSTETSQENAQLELKLEHVTAALGGGLIKLDCGNLPRRLAPVQVYASGSIFSNPGGASFVAMTGNSPPQDFRMLLSWNGRNNIYDRYSTFWSIVSVEGTGRIENWDFSNWRRNWTETAEGNARQVDGGIWNRRQWMGKSSADLSAADFSLDRQMPGNPAVAGATSSTDAGANLSIIPHPAGDATAELPRD